ncbi:DUF5704 domain-containing protein [Anaerolentibacter hominis]|uniref:DUF5704 domain-containing protein n=1 Tax=Anaerolentibacter hominis TaxID=3079009 RepID=UPI0031B89C7F
MTKRQRIFLFLLAAGIWLVLPPRMCCAKNSAHFEQGSIVFVTEDTIATSSTKWGIVGFHIRRDATHGNPLTDNAYATLYLKEEYRVKEDMGNGKYKVTFTIPRKVVDEALIQGNMAGIKDSDTLYLNGIFQVTRKGIPDRVYYHTLKSIKAAAPWRNPDDFLDHFDVKIKFQSGTYPALVEYRLRDGTRLKEEKLDKKKAGARITVNLKEELEYEGENYSLIQSYLVHLYEPEKKQENYKRSAGYSTAQIAARNGVMKIGGIKFVAVMDREGKGEEDTPQTDVKETDLPEELADAQVVIEADVRDNEHFLVSSGIPVTDSLYINGFVPEYLAEYRFRKITGKRNYTIKVKRNYHLIWYEVTGTEGDMQILPREQWTSREKTVTVSRTYAFWTLEKLNVYIPDKLTVFNQSLPGGSAQLSAANQQIPSVYTRRETEPWHIMDSDYQKEILLPDRTISGDGVCPAIPEEDFIWEADRRTGQINVRNDPVIFNSMTIMADGWQEKETKAPSYLPAEGINCQRDILFQPGFVIPASVSNGWKDSNSSVSYRCMYQAETGLPVKNVFYPVNLVNPVLVHTPVVCDGAVEDCRRFCQLLEPEQERAALVLDRTFQVVLLTQGNHKAARGYYFRDYGKYTAKRQVRFPFDVYRDKQYYPPDTWIDIGDETEFYLPIWVEEGNYKVEFRSVAVNASGRTDRTEYLYNGDYENYTAVDTVNVQVSGRLYSFRIYDIADYPRWRAVFRRMNSLHKSGFSFSVADMPLNEKSHPLLKTDVPLKPGYFLRMRLTTVGEMDDEACHVVIRPAFYYTDADGNGRRPVDIYYNETIQGKSRKLVKVGSRADSENQKRMKLGDPYLAVDSRELDVTGRLKNKEVSALKESLYPVFTYAYIDIPEGMQTLTGSMHYEAVFPIPAEKMELAGCSKQEWYFSYTLPGQIYVAEKDAPVEQTGKEYGIDFSERFWLKDGRLVLSFDIITVREKKPVLSYINAENATEGYCNQWAQEQQNEYLPYGDVAVFTLRDGVMTDYENFGSH